MEDYPSEFLIGDFTFEPDAQTLTGNGKQTRLDPKDLSVLRHLIEAAPSVVSTEDLLNRSWPGSVVGDNALQQVIARLRRAFGDDARSPTYIETLPRRGYRLLVSARTAQDDIDQAIPKAGVADSQKRQVTRKLSIFALAGLVSILLVGWYIYTPGPPAYKPATLHIEPFEIIGTAPNAEAWARSALAVLKEELAIRRTIDVVQDPAAEFSLQPLLLLADSVIEVKLQLHDRSGKLMGSFPATISAEQLQRLEFPALVNLVTRIQTTAGASRTDRLSSESEAAREHFRRFDVEWGRIGTASDGDWTVALEHLDRAIASDPAFFEAHTQRSMLLSNRLADTLPVWEALPEARASINAALAINPSSGWARYGEGQIQSFLELDYAAALANFEYAREAEFPLGVTLQQIGAVHANMGELAEAEDFLHSALSADPYGDRMSVLRYLGLVQMAQGRYTEALLTLDQAVNAGGSPHTHLIRARAAYHAGQIEQMAHSLREVEKQIGGRRPEFYVDLLVLAGQEEEARARLEAIERDADAGKWLYATSVFFAYLHLNDLDHAFAWLDRLVANREHWDLAILKKAPYLDTFRSHPRFQAALARLRTIENYPREEDGGQRVAVSLLPFVAQSESPDLRSFATTAHTDLSHEMTRAGLVLVSLTDSVEALYQVSGSVSEHPDGIRATFQIMHRDTGSIIWSGQNIYTDGFSDAPFLASSLSLIVLWTEDARNKGAKSLALSEFLRGYMEFQALAQGYETASWHTAESRYLDALRVDPDWKTPCKNLAILYQNRLGGDLDYSEASPRAHQYARCALEADPNDTFALGTINARIDLDYAAAIANFEHAKVHRTAHSGEVEFEIGTVLLNQGKVDEAITRLLAADRQGALNNRLATYLVLAGAYLAKGDYEQANQYIDRYITGRGNPESVWLLAYLDKVLMAFMAGDVADAQAHYDLAWSVYGGTRPLQFAGIRALLGDEEGARELLAQSESAFEESTLKSYGQAFWAAYHLEDYESASIWLKRAINNREPFLPAQLKVGRIFAGVRDQPWFTEALEHLARVEATGTPTPSVAWPPK